METLIVSVILVLVVGGAVLYIYKAKKRGVKCIGCPDSGKCSGHCASCACACGMKDKK